MTVESNNWPSASWTCTMRVPYYGPNIYLLKADSSSQYDAIRAYLKELDITEKVWIGLSKTSEKPNFVWTNFQPLSGDGHWQEALPTGESQSLCAVMDPAADFLWRPLPCGGPEVAAFICELPNCIPPITTEENNCLSQVPTQWPVSTEPVDGGYNRKSPHTSNKLTNVGFTASLKKPTYNDDVSYDIHGTNKNVNIISCEIIRPSKYCTTSFVEIENIDSTTSFKETAFNNDTPSDAPKIIVSADVFKNPLPHNEIYIPSYQKTEKFEVSASKTDKQLFEILKQVSPKSVNVDYNKYSPYTLTELSNVAFTASFEKPTYTDDVSYDLGYDIYESTPNDNIVSCEIKRPPSFVEMTNIASPTNFEKPNFNNDSPSDSPKLFVSADVFNNPLPHNEIYVPSHQKTEQFEGSASKTDKQLFEILKQVSPKPVNVDYNKSPYTLTELSNVAVTTNFKKHTYTDVSYDLGYDIYESSPNDNNVSCEIIRPNSFVEMTNIASSTNVEKPDFNNDTSSDTPKKIVSADKFKNAIPHDEIVIPSPETDPYEDSGSEYIPSPVTSSTSDFVPSWALGPKGCLLTELPSLTVLYIPEQSALELTSDCGLDGTKRIACKGNADREEILRQLTCVISNDDIDEDKSTKTSTSDYYETSTSDENSIISKTSKSWTFNTISVDYGMPTRHRRETEDTLSPGSTKSSFKEVPTKELSWQDTHREKTVLTTQHIPALNDNASPTTATSFDVHLTTDALITVKSTPTLNIKVANQYFADSNDNRKAETENITKTPNTHIKVAQKDIDSQITTKQDIKFTTSSSKVNEMTAPITKKFGSSQSSNGNLKAESLDGTSSTITQEGNVEEYPSAINQGQLFSIVMNGSMYDIAELNNETEQDTQINKSPKTLFTVTTSTALPVTETKKIQNPDILNKENGELKKIFTKKPIQPTKKYTKDFPKGKYTFVNNIATSERPIINIQTVDQIEENLTKEFEMMPVISDIAPKLNRTFRKELPAIIDENSGLESGSQFGVPRILNFTVTNTIDSEEDGFQQDQPQQDTNITETIILSEEIEAKTDRVPDKLNVDSNPINNKLSTTTFPEIPNVAIKVNTTLNTPSDTKPIVKVNPKAEIDLMPLTHIEPDQNKKEETSTILVHHPIDPRLYILNQHPGVPKNNDSEFLTTVKPQDTTDVPKIAKEEYLPKSLLGDKNVSPETTKQSEIHSGTTEAYTEHPFPSDEPKKVNRHRSLHSSKQRKFYPYFFSRMLG